MARLVWNTRTTFANDPVFQEMAYPIVVHLMRKPPEYAAEYERIFGAPVVFESAWNAMQIDPRFLLLKQPPVNRYVFAVLTERADALLESFNESRTTAGRVKGVLMKMLHTGEASMDAVAGKLGQSRQTLYRNLKDEGVTYEQVLDDLRRKLALDFLAAKKVSVNETAYLVGFSDPASFSRAFKRWTGKSPSEVRLSAQKRGAA
jgi:AraC-like DNA-binding protein